MPTLTLVAGTYTEEFECPGAKFLEIIGAWEEMYYKKMVSIISKYRDDNELPEISDTDPITDDEKIYAYSVDIKNYAISPYIAKKRAEEMALAAQSVADNTAYDWNNL